MDALQAAFLATTSPEQAPRKAAEAFLAHAKTQPGFALAALQLAASTAVEEPVRQAAAVAFKNLLKFHWEPPLPPAEQANAAQPLAIGDAEKEQIKATVVGVMLRQPPRIQAQLSEALALIAATDFPDRWPALLPELLAALGSGDVAVANGVLAAADAVFVRFRDQYRTVELVRELKYVLGLFVAPLLELLKATGVRLAGPEGGQADTARLLLTSVLYVCRIFYSLNYHDLPGTRRSFGCAGYWGSHSFFCLRRGV